MGGALLYTSAPFGLFLATFVNDLFTRQMDSLASNPDLSWRAVFLTGLIPAVVALLIRIKVKESEEWAPSEKAPRIRELFSPELRRRTIGALILSITALITWWTCSAFLPVVASYLAQTANTDPSQLALEKTAYITTATTRFNLGGLIGTLLTIPAALYLGRRPMFAIYFGFSAIGVWATYALPLSPDVRMFAMGLTGVTVFGVFGAFSFYLPELFPTRLRGTGAGFCYNFGRIATAFFPFLVGVIVRSGISPLETLKWVAVAPALGLVAMAFGYGDETKQQTA